MERNELAASGVIALPADLNIGVWRYMDLAKFVSMLRDQAVHFVRADCLGDRFEGSISQSSLEGRPVAAAAYAKLITDTLSPMSADSPVTGAMMESMLASMRQRMMREVMISCWHMGNAESAAMWRIYTSAGKGVAVRSTATRLIAALPAQQEDSAITVSVVNYVDYAHFPVPDPAHALIPFLYKRESFSYEQELRAMLIHRDGPPFYAVPVDMTTLVESVYVAPGTPDWKREVVKSLLDRYGLGVAVKGSKLDDPAVR